MRHCLPDEVRWQDFASSSSTVRFPKDLAFTFERREYEAAIQRLPDEDPWSWEPQAKRVRPPIPRRTV